MGLDHLLKAERLEDLLARDPFHRPEEVRRARSEEPLALGRAIADPVPTDHLLGRVETARVLLAASAGAGATSTAPCPRSSGVSPSPTTSWTARSTQLSRSPSSGKVGELEGRGLSLEREECAGAAGRWAFPGALERGNEPGIGTARKERTPTFSGAAELLAEAANDGEEGLVGPTALEDSRVSVTRSPSSLHSDRRASPREPTASA